MTTFTRHSNGEIFDANDINEIQIAIEALDSTHYTASAVDALIAGVAQDIDFSVPSMPMFSGQYYSTFTHGLGRTTSGTMATMTLTQDRVVMVPIYLPHAVTLDLIGINVITLVASSTIRLGIFTMDYNTKTATRILDAGAVSGATTGAKGITISQALDAGVYWLGLNTSHAGVGVSGEFPSRGLGMSNATGALYSALVRASATYAAFGATESVPSFVTSEAPNIYIRIV